MRDAGPDARSDGGRDLPRDLSGDARDAGDTGPLRVAANGVPIPPPALDPCVALDLQSADCSPSGTCAPVSCDCGGTSLVFAECTKDCTTCTGKCVAAISCAAACALGSNAPPEASSCLFGAVVISKLGCKSDADCANAKCLVPPDAAVGECTTGLPRSPCLADTDCTHQASGLPLPAEDPACVVTAQGVGVCGNAGLVGDPCNTDDQCSSLFRCVLTPGAFEGACSRGENGDLCFTKHDCAPSYTCLAIGGVGPALCTSGMTGT
ncbi:MAG TPA: hypothetical protein VH560_15460, partial [Polyangia bacterium]|nr:hypothetical protein [Polyangia bacterium]